MFRWKSGLTYIGDLEENRRVGKSRLCFANGDEFYSDNWHVEQGDDDVFQIGGRNGKIYTFF
jgi:hypothetical protein